MSPRAIYDLNRLVFTTNVSPLRPPGVVSITLVVRSRDRPAYAKGKPAELEQVVIKNVRSTTRIAYGEDVAPGSSEQSCSTYMERTPSARPCDHGLDSRTLCIVHPSAVNNDKA